MKTRGFIPCIACITACIAAALSSSPARSQEEATKLEARALGLDERGFEELFSRGRAAPGGRLDPRPDVESLRVLFDPKIMSRGLARVEARFQGTRRKELLTFPVGEHSVALNDLGEGLDREAGDGIFTGSVELDLSAQLADQLEAVGGRLDPRAEEERFVFAGRELVARDSREPQDEDLDAVAPRIARLERIAPRLRQMSDREILAALRFEPGEPIFEIRREKNLAIERFLGLPPRLFLKVLASAVDPDASLMVTAVPVVEDAARTFDPCTGAGTPGGPWTFAHLMREMATGTGFSAEDLTLLWLNTWALPQTANGFLVQDPGRAAQLQAKVTGPWLAAGGGSPDVERFPARLLAIANRPDLADAIGYGQPGTGGEGRFVFGLLDPSTCASLPFTVIFEYGVQVKGCHGLKTYHQEWKDLDANPIGSPAYNAALEAITRQFTDHGTNPGQLPNQSSLNQLRTNEIALGAPWELREFTLQGPGSSSPGALGLVTVKQTPDLGLNNTPTLAAYIASDQADILADQHVIPLRFPGLLNPFLGAKAPTPNPAFFWQAPGVLGMPDGVDLRHKVSLATCSGCHAGETQTFFTHIGNLGRRTPGTPAALSGFLTGMSMPDPGDPTVTRTFDDLAMRQQALADILNRTCFRLSVFPRFLPVTFPH